MAGRDLGRPGVPRLLDCVTCDDGRIRAFLGAGTSPDAIDPAGAGLVEIRPVAGAVMAVLEAGSALCLKSGEKIPLHPDEAESEFLAGRNCLLGQRIAETPAQIAEWLSYHHRNHGAQGAVILNRAQDDGLAAALARLPGDLPLRVIVLESALPLGKPGMGPETHPFLAPDAPGKDRMTPPEPDPWRAPLGEPLVHEIAKWRFLARARAVLALDVSDYLAPEAADAFQRALDAPQGVIGLVGRRVYPWRVRAGQEARMADHICRQFDQRRGFARWGVAPRRAGLDRTWRLVRVAHASPGPGDFLPFYRAMALRVPGWPTARLVPKTSLIEDGGLVRMATEIFGHKPVRAPVNAPRPAPRAAHAAQRTAIVTTMKNEGPFILEWIAYHRAIGVDDFLIYTNDCTDGTDRMLDLLQRKGIVQHRVNPWRPGGALKPQHAALQAAEAEAVIRDCDWAICMDVDEFINVRIGDGTLAALYRAMGDANMISLTWRLFGNADIVAYQDRFVIEQFTRCAPEIVRKPHQAWGFKTLFRNIDIYKKMGVHRPKGLRPDLWDQVRWLNGSGRPMPREMFRNGWRSTLDTYGYDWVQLNHYAVRSVESFLVKRDRGRVNHVDRDQGLNYWFRMNHNAEEDRSILRMLPRLRAEHDRLMADPEIRAAHEYSVACHRAKIRELLAQDNYRAFHEQLCSERMRNLCRRQRNFGSAVFNAGPHVIPDEIALAPELPPDFFFTVQHSGEARH